MNTVIFAGGNIQDGIFVKSSLKQAEFVIAADSGAEKTEIYGITPNIVVGDFDSLPLKKLDALKKKNVTIIPSFPEKDQTDTQLAVQTALEKGATSISILGGTEQNRLDHVLANVNLTRFSPKIPVYFINGDQKIWIEKGPKKVCIHGKTNDLLSLIPFTEIVTGIKTTNLKYPLSHEPLYFGQPRGISNVFKKDYVSVEFSEGLLLFAHTSIQS